MTNFSNLALTNDAVGFKNLLEFVISNKVNQAIDSLKISIAQNMFREELQIGNGEDEDEHSGGISNPDITPHRMPKVNTGASISPAKPGTSAKPRKQG